MRKKYGNLADFKAVEAASAAAWLKEHGMEESFEDDFVSGDEFERTASTENAVREIIPDPAVTDSFWVEDDKHAVHCEEHSHQACDCEEKPVTGKCAYCGSCLPCPAGIDIPTVHKLYDFALEHGGPSDNLISAYFTLGATAGDCICCAECEARCPNDIPIIARMAQAAETFGE